MDLLPLPGVVEVTPGVVRWRSPLRVSIEAPWPEVLETFGDDLRRAIGWRIDVVDGASACDVRLVETVGLGDEGYRITVDERTLVEASTPAGLSYGLTTLRQLGPVDLWSLQGGIVEAIEVPRVAIADAPRFAWRGAHLDVARHYFDAATVCRFIDLLAAHRLNHLHLHLNDDQGWRVEIPSWPRLTEVGAWRRSSPIGHEDEGVDDHLPHGGFYRASDVATIREHARRRYVEIVPEIDLPGHAQAAVAAYPQLGHGTEGVEVWTRWGISDHVLNVGPVALAFAEEVVRYVAGLFPGGPVHIGGDECPSVEWEHSDLARSTMADHGFTDARQLQGLFTSRLAEVLAADGHRVIAWDDVLDAETPDGVVIAAWQSGARGTAAARRGLDVIMAPMQSFYFDWLSSDRRGEPVAQTVPPFVTTWETVYDADVIPPELEDECAVHVLGAQAQLWTEYIATRDHLDYMAFPRLCAFSELVWGRRSSEGEFRARLEAHLGRLRAMGVHYRPLDDPV